MRQVRASVVEGPPPAEGFEYLPMVEITVMEGDQKILLCLSLAEASYLGKSLAGADAGDDYKKHRQLCYMNSYNPGDFSKDAV